jgi:Ran-binding protein 9/10
VFRNPYTQHRFSGHVQNPSDAKDGSGLVVIKTYARCEDVCLLSDIPIMAGLYDIQGKTGIYFEVSIQKMKGVIAIGKPASISHQSF